MSNFNIMPSNPDSKKEESIRVDKNTKSISGTLSIFSFVDKDTNQFVAYCPALDISGYGETEVKALELFKFSIIEYFDYLINLKMPQIEAELAYLGWQHNKFRNKEYSKAYVDIDGQLKNFNAVDGKVERLTLQAA